MFLQIDLTFLVTFFIIWILVFVLSRIFFKPMIKLMQDRDSQIRGDWSSSEKNIEAYEGSLQEVDKTLRSAKQAAEKTHEEMEVEAIREKGRLVAEVSGSSKEQIGQAKAKLQAELVSLKKELAAEAETLAERIEKRLLN
jgi:F-type H+-transporting ATPase subunit b